MAGLTILDRARAAVVGAVSGASKGWRFQGLGGSSGFWPAMTPGSNFDYAQAAGDVSKNNIVAASIQWVMRALPEGRVEVLSESENGHQKVLQHPLTKLVRNPNDGYSGTLLLQATAASLNLAGNAYWVKLRNSMGVPVQLWYVPHFQLFPRWDAAGQNYVTYYEYRLQNERIPIDPKDVIHFRNGLDPNNTRMGIAPLDPVLREIFTDNEAANFSASLLRNAGIPGIIISPSTPDSRMDDPEHVKALFLTKFTGDKRGEPLVLDGGVKVDTLSFSPADMNLRDLRRLPEERISAMLGIPAMVVGFGAGLERSTFTNMSEARLMAYENNIVPTYHLIADELTRSLLPELGDEDIEVVQFNTDAIRVLQDDQTANYTRQNIGYQGGFIKRSEARLAVGKQVTSEDDVYITDVVPAQAQAQLDQQAETAKAQLEAQKSQNEAAKQVQSQADQQRNIAKPQPK